MPWGKPSPVRSVRVPDDVWAKVVARAEAEGMTASEWIVDTLRRRVRRAG